jgi:hypothetical protein
MRLPIEHDWKPNLGNKQVDNSEYEKHVRGLAERLQRANKTAKQQSRLSHDTAKRYYDRPTKLEHFNKGDLVYIHDPIYKRGKAKKFSYQYKGPFEIEQRISPLIYKVRLTDGTSTIIHINRLKRAHKETRDFKASPVGGNKNKAVKLGREKEIVRGKCEDEAETDRWDREVPPHSQVEDIEDTDLSKLDENEVNLLQDRGDESQRIPGSSYLQRKLQSDKTADGVAYRLRSRLVSMSGRETENDKAGSEVASSPGSENASNNTSPSKVKYMSNHSYNLRSRIEPTEGTL